MRKKHIVTIVLLILVFYHNKTNAQLPPSTNYYFCALNGTCYNDANNNNPRVYLILEEYSPQQIIDHTESFMEIHPGYTLVAPASQLYNCHGFAYSVFQGGEKLKIDWYEELCSYNGSNTNTKSYIEIDESDAQPGDIVTAVEENWGILTSRHSAIYINEDTLLSKWGFEPLFKHHKNDPWISGQIGLTNNVSHYVYYRRIINTPNQISGPYTFNGTGVFEFYPSIPLSSCTWNVEPAEMFQNASGSGTTAYLSYATPFVYLAPKATITYTFSYGCANHYTVSKEFDLRIPTTTISGNAVSEGFIIDANATVTVTGNIKCNKNAKTIVPVGTKLILDGGTMTSNGTMWKGVEVWGNSSTHQQEVNGSYPQGYIELKNGAVIENAKCAVELWHPDIYSTAGGIIHATDATFRNNAKAVHALYYTYSPSGGTSDYNGYLRNCTFTIDEDYLGTESFSKHVDLSHVSGFDIEGCSFSTMRNVAGVSPYCVGIGAYSAGFRVDSYCDHPNANNMTACPEENLVPCSFTNFYQGIHASGDGGRACSFRVENSVFNNNNYGLYALNTGYGIVVNNDFVVGCGWDCDFGIYADGVSNFCIEDNTFQPKVTNTGLPYGIAIVNSKSVNDVYNNDFQNLRCGNVAVGSNIVTRNSPSLTVQGLTYTCNTNSGNLIDFCVLKDGNTGDIATQQGSATMPAGNTFSGSQYHFYNDGNNWIGYYYEQNNPSQTPINTSLYRVSTHFTSSSNSCNSHYNGGSVTKSAAEKAALASEYLSARSTYNSLLQLYESRIDGGSTSSQVADIHGATPSDLWQLRAQLLGISPYVSGEVLTTAADRYDVFTDPVLFEILAANPDELRKDSLISYLETKDHPLPTYMTDLLREMASGFTARTALLGQMAQYGHDFRLAAGDIVRSCLNDSVTDLTELRTWLANMDDIASDRMIVASYLQEGDSVHAFGLANMLPELYGLQGDAHADHTDYMRLIELYQTLNRESRNVNTLTDTELSMVNGIAASGTGTSKTMAEAILMERFDENILSSECPTMPGNNGGIRRSASFKDTALNEALGFTASVSPNPATTWTTVEYKLPADKSQASFSVTNTLGVIVMSTELNGKQEQKVLDLHSLADGVYFYTIRCGEYTTTGKLVITK